MPNLYSIQFEVVPQNAASSAAVAKELLGRVGRWVQEKYLRAWNTQCIFPSGNQRLEPLPGHSLDLVCHEVTDGSLARVRWIHPDDKDATMRWTTDLSIAHLDDRVQVALQLGVASASFFVRPAWMTIGRPRIVTEILTDYPCWIGTRPILPHKQIVEASDVPDFVNDILLDPGRALPVVVLSHDRFTDTTYVDAERLHHSLLGFAHVAVFDKWAAFRLTDSLGKSLSCFNGCIRIYWPGLTRTSDPMHHELYFPVQIQKFEFSGKPFDRRLFNFLAKVSAFRFAEGEVIRQVQARVDGQRMAEAERVRAQIQQGAQDAKTLQDVKEMLDLAIEENTSLLNQVRQIEREKADLAAEVETLKSNWNLFQQHQSLTEDEQAAEPVPETPEPETVIAALEQIEAEFGNDLVILDSAKESARASDFARPVEVYQALMAIRDVGNLYFDTVRMGGSMGGWAEQLSKRGFNQYSQTESDTVKNDYKKYGRYRNFMVNGSKRPIYQHLDLGGGDRKNCLQIYFEADRKLNKVIIAYCGEHLPFPRQRT
jgi:hypothetical protein